MKQTGGQQLAADQSITIVLVAVPAEYVQDVS